METTMKFMEVIFPEARIKGRSRGEKGEPPQQWLLHLFPRLWNGTALHSAPLSLPKKLCPSSPVWSELLSWVTQVPAWVSQRVCKTVSVIYSLPHHWVPNCSSDSNLSSVQSLSRVWLFVTPWIPARQASLSITSSRSSLILTSTESVMPSSHLILCRPLLLLPAIPPSIRVFSNESTLHMRIWPKPSNWLYRKDTQTSGHTHIWQWVICFHRTSIQSLSYRGKEGSQKKKNK